MSLSRIVRIVRLALKSLLLHKLRSALTMLGIVFGVFSVIAMLAIGEGASAQAQKQVLELGATNILVVSIKPPDEPTSGAGASNTWVLRYGLKRTDYDRLSRLPTVANAIPIRQIPEEVRYLHRVINARVVACTGDYLDVNHLEMADGRFISDRDLDEISNVAVLGDETAQKLFPLENPINRSVQIKGEFYRVIGVTKHRTASAAIGGSLAARDYNNDVYIPLETFRRRIAPNDQIFRRSSGSFSVTQIELDQITLQVKDREAVLPTAEAVREVLQLEHADTKDVDVVVPLELLRQADQIRQIFNIVLGSIAAISLVVGGIGIMNIMLATVTERTREIGIRRALGARQRDIIEQFLTETIVLAGTGGLIGVALGLLTPFAFGGIQAFVTHFVLDSSADATSEMGRMFSQMKPQIALWSLPVAFGISVGIGIVFGLYPARAAAKLDPIEALRHE